MRNDKVYTRLKEIRRERGLSQRELAEKAGVGQDRICRYENGQPMNTETLLRIVKILDVSADYFLGLVGKKES
jgi:transcriptional regulator with XRE-family HTH domain